MSDLAGIILVVVLIVVGCVGGISWGSKPGKMWLGLTVAASCLLASFFVAMHLSARQYTDFEQKCQGMAGTVHRVGKGGLLCLSSDGRIILGS